MSHSHDTDHNTIRFSQWDSEEHIHRVNNTIRISQWNSEEWDSEEHTPCQQHNQDLTMG